MGSTQPGRHSVAQAFVQNILKNTGKRGDGNQCEPIVLPRDHTASRNNVSYSMAKQ